MIGDCCYSTQVVNRQDSPLLQECVTTPPLVFMRMQKEGVGVFYVYTTKDNMELNYLWQTCSLPHEEVVKYSLSVTFLQIPTEKTPL